MIGDVNSILRTMAVGWATYVQEVRYVAGAWMRRSDRCPPMFYSTNASNLVGHMEMVGNKLPTLRNST